MGRGDNARRLLKEGRANHGSDLLDVPGLGDSLQVGKQLRREIAHFCCPNG